MWWWHCLVFLAWLAVGSLCSLAAWSHLGGHAYKLCHVPVHFVHSCLCWCHCAHRVWVDWRGNHTDSWWSSGGIIPLVGYRWVSKKTEQWILIASKIYDIYIIFWNFDAHLNPIACNCHRWEHILQLSCIGHETVIDRTCKICQNIHVTFCIYMSIWVICTQHMYIFICWFWLQTTDYLISGICIQCCSAYRPF